jgi:hypothetical protein
MACKPLALVVAAVVSLGSLWPPSEVGGETPAVPGKGPLCQRIPEEWTPFTYKGMEFYRVPLPAGAHPASSVGTVRCSEIPKEWMPFTYQGRRFFRIPLQPGSQAAAR